MRLHACAFLVDFRQVRCHGFEFQAQVLTPPADEFVTFASRFDQTCARHLYGRFDLTLVTDGARQSGFGVERGDTRYHRETGP